MATLPDCFDVYVKFKNDTEMTYMDILRARVELGEVDWLTLTPGNGELAFKLELESIYHYDILRPSD